MNVKRYRALIGLLLLALVGLPGQSLYAQSKMLPLNADSHTCHRMDKQGGQEKAHPQAMKSCQQNQSQCNPSCGDCFHCSSMNAVLEVPSLSTEQSTFVFIHPSRDSHTSLPASAQFRPPKLII